MRVLGLDIAPHAVACVEMDTAFGRFEIRDTHEIKLNPGQDPIMAAQQLMLGLGRRVDRLVTSAPVEISTFRNLQIASKDKRAIRAALEFELEDDLPFEKENLHYDSAILNSSSNSSLVHVGACKKPSFETHLRTLQNSLIDPDIITSDTWAYRCLFTRISPKMTVEEPSMLIGFDFNKTFFYVHHQGRPILYREVPFGIATVEKILEDKLGANPAEIKNWIQDVGVTGIDAQVSNAISDILETLVPELKQTELAARTTLQDPINQIFVTGEGALLPGFMNWLGEASGKTVSLFRPLSQLSASQVTYSDLSEIRFAKALALAVSTIPADKIHPINFRKGVFAKANAGGVTTWDLIKKPLPYAAILFVVFISTKFIEYNYYKGKLADADETLTHAVKGYFSGVSDSAIRSRLADPNKLKANIQSDLDKERELSKLFSSNPTSPFDYLKTLSQSVGRDVVLDMVEFDVGSDTNEAYKDNRVLPTSLTIVVSNPQMLSRLNDILSKNFGLKRGTSEEITEEGRKLLKVVFSGQFSGNGGGSGGKR